MTENKIEIVVLDKKIPVAIEDREISKLLFWDENPRVNSVIKRRFGGQRIGDKEIESILKEEEHVKELFQEIKRHGGLIDEILVKGNIVLEGNSRLCAYRMLYEKAEQANDEDEMLRWTYIKCKVIPDNTDQESIFTILGTWHIKGKKAWNTFEKIAYLKRMMEKYGYTPGKVAEIINETETFVEDNIEAHDLMVTNEVYDLDKYSYFIEMVKNRKIKQEISKEPAIKGKLIKAIKDGQFNRAEEIRDVYKVLKDKVAKRIFFDDVSNFSEALETTKDRNPEFDDTFYRQMKTTTEKLKKLTIKKAKAIQEEIKEDSNKKDIVRRFQREVKIFCSKVGLGAK